ncbi:MAG: hypothetical protein QNI87_12105 [Erythrobacter sp.]|uniref:hypothetical protein n=1 Tax=Erythrobacter sp. TaxID=1042 RepID=UPI0026101ECE|nr:hypothetical protein [Erythrobacter sp.]MDJ0979260.1 hypothetical protein [Erythrobacter sp.]
MKTDLELLSELRDLLDQEPTETLCIAWWDRVLSVEASLEADPRTSEHEKKLVAQLRAAMSDLIRAYREGQNLHTSQASVAISALESSIQKRTTGADGWPLKS